MGWKVINEQTEHRPECPVCGAPRNAIERKIDDFAPKNHVFQCSVCRSVLMKT